MTDRSPLDRIKVASPCSADWNQMQGDERRRFCAECKLHVHDLSAMRRDEATALLQQAGKGRVCVRFYRRADGTVLTQDCPVGLRQKLRWAVARACALWLFVCSGLAACVRSRTEPSGGPEPVPAPAPLMGDVLMPGDVPEVQPHVMGEVEMGAVPVPIDPQPATDTPRVLQGKVRIEPR